MADPNGTYIRTAQGIWVSGKHAAGDGFVLGTTKPSALNTGVPAGTTYGTTYTSALTLTAGNQSFTNCRFSTTVTLKSSGNTFTNCYFDGPPTWSSQRPIVSAVDVLNDGATQNVFRRCTFKPQTPLHGVDTFQGFNVWFDRCDFSNGVDGFDIVAPASISYDANVRIDGCYVHDLAYFSPDSNQSNNHTHNDPIQLQGCKGVYSTGSFYSGFWDPNVGDGSVPGVWDGSGNLVQGNCNDNYDPPGAAGPTLGLRYCNSQIQFNGNANTDNIHFTNDWFEGGASGMNIIGASGVHLYLTNCIFDIPMYGAQNIIRDTSAGAGVVAVSGCKYADGSAMAGTVGAGRTNLG